MAKNRFFFKNFEKFKKFQIFAKGAKMAQNRLFFLNFEKFKNFQIFAEGAKLPKIDFIAEGPLPRFQEIKIPKKPEGLFC